MTLIETDGSSNRDIEAHETRELTPIKARRWPIAAAVLEGSVSATGAAFNRSLGHRPRKYPHNKIKALKARFIAPTAGRIRRASVQKSQTIALFRVIRGPL